MDLLLSSRRVGGWLVVRVEGELDIATADLLRDRLTAALLRGGRSARVIVDLTGLDFCDASGLGALVAAYSSARRYGGRLRLAIAEGRVLRVVRLTGTDRLIPVFPAVPDALARSDAEAVASAATARASADQSA